METFFFFQAEDGIRDIGVTGVQTCALPIFFAHPPGTVQREWLAEQCRLALSPGYLEAHMAVLRALVSPLGQREVLVDHLPSVKTPTLIVWGARDRVFPESQAREAAFPLPQGFIIPP